MSGSQFRKSARWVMMILTLSLNSGGQFSFPLVPLTTSAKTYRNKPSSWATFFEGPVDDDACGDAREVRKIISMRSRRRSDRARPIA